MHPDKLLYPALFHEGQAYFFEKSDAHTGSYFGGPFEGAITGLKPGSYPLHHITTLNGHCFEPLWHVIGGRTLSLLYGIRYDGCRMRYKSSAAGVEVMEMTPEDSALNWPYSDYPMHLPYFPLRLQQRAKCSLAEFLELSCQPIDLAPSDVLVLIPPSPVLDMSLWGPSGDGENTQIVFRCDLSNRTIEAYNQCG